MEAGAQIISAVRHSDRALAEQVSEWESLEFGVAHTSSRFRESVAANQLREVWLADVAGSTAYERAEEYYRLRGLRCISWTCASGQAIEPVETLLAANGWRRVDSTAMGLERWDLLRLPAPADLRVLPARAMPKAFRATFAERPAEAEVEIERLNDANLDAHVALLNGEPAGRLGYLQAGEIARVNDVFVLPAWRRRGVGRGLLAHTLHIARRLLPKAIVCRARCGDTVAARYFESCGFKPAGVVTEFIRM